MNELYWNQSRLIKVGSNIVRLDDVICMVGEDNFTTLYFKTGESIDVNTTIDELWSIINGG